MTRTFAIRLNGSLINQQVRGQLTTNFELLFSLLLNVGKLTGNIYMSSKYKLFLTIAYVWEYSTKLPQDNQRHVRSMYYEYING